MVTASPPSSLAPSPCINVCQLDAQRRWCTGCWRRLDEIAAWSKLPDDARRRVLQALPARREAGQADDRVI